MDSFNGIKPQSVVSRVKICLYVDGGKSEEASPLAAPVPPAPEPAVSISLPSSQSERVEEPERAAAPEIRAAAPPLHSGLPIAIPHSTNTLSTLTGKS